MKTYILDNGQTPDSVVSDIGIVEGKSFSEFREDLIEHNQNPFCRALGIPAEMDWFIDPHDTFRYNTLAEHRAFLRFQICRWIYEDDEYEKPVYLIGATSFNEIRMLSGIQNIRGIFINRIYSKTFEDNLPYLYAAAGDDEALAGLLKDHV